MSCAWDNSRELLDGQGTLNLEPCLLSWKYNVTNLKNDMYTFNESIDIRDGIKECNGFTKVKISRFILNICTRLLDNDTNIYIYIYIYITLFYMAESFLKM